MELLCNFAIICPFDSPVCSATVLPSSLLTHASSSSFDPPLKIQEALLSLSHVPHCPADAVAAVVAAVVVAAELLTASAAVAVVLVIVVAAAVAAVELDVAAAAAAFVPLTAAAVVFEKCYTCPLKNLVAPLHEVPSTDFEKYFVAAQ